MSTANTTDNYLFLKTTASPPATIYLLDPGKLAQQPSVNPDFIGLANSYRCPRGMHPGEAWLLLLGSDVATIGNKPVQLGAVSPAGGLSFSGWLFLHKANCMSPGGIAADPNAAFLCQFFDCRHILRMAATVGIGDSTANANTYNVRLPEPSDPTTLPTPPFFPNTTNSGAAWTWQTMLQDLWNQIASIPFQTSYSTAPMIPYTPNGVPENFRFIGMSVWDAIAIVLDRLDCELIYAPDADSFTLAQRGVAQTFGSGGVTLAAMKASFAGLLVNDYYPQEFSATRFPQTVRVFFGTTYPRWQDSLLPFKSIDVSTGVGGVLDSTVVCLWDDLLAEYTEVMGVNTLVNGTALTARANERATNYINGIQLSDARTRTVFSGAIPFSQIGTGSQISEMVWADNGAGLITEIRQSPAKARYKPLSGPAGASALTPLYTDDNEVALATQGYGQYVAEPPAKSILLGKWLGDSTHGVTGNNIWPLGTLEPVEIYGGSTPGMEVDQNAWLNVQNWYGPVLPGSFVIIGYNGFGWYLIGPTETLILAQYPGSPGNPQYWKPGAYQDLLVYQGSPYSETVTTITVPNVANRFGAIAPGYVWIVYSQFNDTVPNDAGWYAIAPQGMALLGQYVGTDPWFYNTSAGTNNVKVYGGPTPGSENDQGWFLNDTWNYNEDIVPTTNVPTPWVWLNSNGYVAGITGYDYNWYVVQDASEKPYCRLTQPFTSTTLGPNSSGDIQWTATAIAGFTTTDSIHFAIPDNRKYLITFTLVVRSGWSGSYTGPDVDAVDVQIALGLSGSTIAEAGCRVGYVAVPTYLGTPTLMAPLTPTWNYEDMGARVITMSAVIAAAEGSNVHASMLLSAINGSGSAVNFNDQAGAPIEGSLTITPFDQG